MNTASTSKKSLSRILPHLLLALIVTIAVIEPNLAQAAGGLDKVNQSMQKVLDLLRGVSITVVTIAIIWAGYKMAFQHARFMDVVPVLGGGLVVGAATEIARYLI
ncbi:TrbC/VirB2 family protein [Brucella sp. 6810]|uniref:TrbC/VirB2 family protein n=1 Tax=Brucella inopinata TaxID=1218315 RepID=A0AAW7B2S4_9HYPH|nr:MULTISPECIES: TrbC/VirB2 family protein [Brucella]KEY05003.1 type IV secretion protein VirB2 [Brucella suis bv. 4 str. 40]APX68116.1 type IV secretion system protein VirB2 [Brucella sp. 09RB8471]EFM56039.1 type IV secretion system protein VirB2 [Brucella inopinata BO1]EFM60097.1 type IV secretion system protein VirB2 [Brucella sp. BO2]MDL2333415.1 TrbC/VirB2 family protein [Brucella inopinata]